MKKTEKILRVATIVIFAVLITLPLLNTFLKFIPEYEGNENRNKAKKPTFSVNNISEFSSDFEDYYTDNFSLRENIIKELHKFEYSFFKISSSPERVIIGKQGWFYAKKSEPNYKGANLFSKSELTVLQEDLIARTNWAKKQNMNYYVAVIPNKMDIYPEYLPSNIIKISKETRYDQMVELAKTPGLNIVDIRKNILKHKNEGSILYQKTDDHWNDLGAYFGYQEIMNQIAEGYNQISPIPIDSFSVVNEIKEGNIASLVNLAKDNPENFVRLNPKFKSDAKDGEKYGFQKPNGLSEWDFEIIKENKKAPDLTCLVIRDSFTLLLIQYLKEHFSKMVLIHDDWKYRMREDIIEVVQPDIIINIILESELNKLLEYPFHKTVNYYYMRLKTNSSKFEELKENAQKNNISVEKMLKLDALWIFNNNNDRKNYINLDYFRFLCATQDSLKPELTNLIKNVHLTPEESIDSCANRLFYQNRTLLIEKERKE